MWSLVKQQPASAPWWGSPVALESPSSANDRSWKESPCQRRSDRRPWCLTGLDQGPQTVYQTKNEWSWLTQLFRYILPIIVVWFSNRKSSGWWFQSLPSIPDGFSHPINQDSNEFPLKVAGYRLSSQLSGRRTSTAPVGTRILSETMADLWLICGFAATMLDVAGATNHAGASLARSTWRYQYLSEIWNGKFSSFKGKNYLKSEAFSVEPQVQIRQVTVDCLGVGGATDHGVPEPAAILRAWTCRASSPKLEPFHVSWVCFKVCSFF